MENSSTINPQIRKMKVLATLLASMIVGALTLIFLEENSPSAGPFCLWRYERLTPKIELVASPGEKIDVNDIRLSLKRLIVCNTGNIKLRDILLSVQCPKSTSSIDLSAGPRLIANLSVDKEESQTYYKMYKISCAELRKNEAFTITLVSKEPIVERWPIVAEIVGKYAVDAYVGNSLTTAFE